MQGTDIYFVLAKDSRVKKGLPWTVLTLLAGWWGIPRGGRFAPFSPWSLIYAAGTM